MVFVRKSLWRRKPGDLHIKCMVWRLRHTFAHAWLGSQDGEKSLPSLKCSWEWKGCSHRGQYFARGIQGFRSQAFFAFTSDLRHMQMHSRAQKLWRRMLFLTVSILFHVLHRFSIGLSCLFWQAAKQALTLAREVRDIDLIGQVLQAPRAAHVGVLWCIGIGCIGGNKQRPALSEFSFHKLQVLFFGAAHLPT